MSDELLKTAENPYQSPMAVEREVRTSSYRSAGEAFLAGVRRGIKIGRKWMGLILGSLVVLIFVFVGVCMAFITVQYGIDAGLRVPGWEGIGLFILACVWTTFCAAAASGIIMGIGESVAYWRAKQKS